MEALDENDSKTFLFFGKDIFQIPCMKKSLATGFIGAFAGWAATLLYTSNTRLSSHIGFGSYWLVVIGSFFTCRYDNFTRRKALAPLEGLKMKKLPENEYILPKHLGPSKIDKVGDGIKS